MTLSGIAVLIIIIAAVFFLTLNLVRSLFKALRITFFILIILGGVVTYFVIEDIKDFADTINENATTYLLDEGSDDIRTGFFATRLNLTTFTPLTEDAIEAVLVEPPGKIFIVEKTVLNTSTINEQIAPLGLDVEDMFESSDYEMRARAFGLSLAASIEEQGTFDMLMHIREGNITIQPRTPVVFVFTSTPRQLYKQARGLVVNEANDRFELLREQVGT